MMDSLLVELAWKSVVISGGALLLLHLLLRRTAAERSLVAHAGLVATLVLPIAVLLIPTWAVEAPAVLSAPLAGTPGPMTPFTTGAGSTAAQADWPWTDLLAWGYLLPASLLLFATVAAVARLFVLRARASVLVDMPWLSALAHAQRRMGFKHGTALLVSDELVSPVSWGVMRPIILLDPRAVACAHEAEAIIAHELAHVARLDWAKLLAARLATALFWFNPLVWKLAAECHQLREEAADDAVLNSQVGGPNYASLLVGAARHENKARLLAAHGVAPGKTSLSRRVARVLDSGLSRAPARRTWALVCAVGAVLLSAPLAALTPVAPGLDLPEVGPDAAATSVVAAVSAAAPSEFLASEEHEWEDGAPAAPAAALAGSAPVPPAAPAPVAEMVAAPAPLPVPSPPSLPVVGSNGIVAQAVEQASAVAGGVAATAVASVTAALDGRPDRASRGRTDLDRVIAMKVHGVTPAYAAALAASDPRFARLSSDELISLRIHGVTPEFIRALKAAGYRDLSPKDVTSAAVMGITPSYVRGMREAGYGGLTLRELVKLRTHGVTPAYIRELRRAGYDDLTAEELTRLRIFGVDAHDLEAEPGHAPRPPRPPRSPRTPDG